MSKDKKKKSTQPTKSNNLDQFLKKFLKFNKNLWKKLNRSQKFFYTGIWSGIIALTAYLIMPPISFHLWMLITIFIVLCGALSDLLFVYNKIWKTNLGKGSILIIYAMLVNFAYSLASQSINEIIRYQSDSLVYTINFVAILSLPFFAISVGIILLSLFIVFTHFFGLLFFLIFSIAPKLSQKLVDQKSSESYFKTTMIIRLVAYAMTLGAMTGIGSTFLPIYDRFINKTAKKFLYVFEAKNIHAANWKKDKKPLT